MLFEYLSTLVIVTVCPLINSLLDDTPVFVVDEIEVRVAQLCEKKAQLLHLF